MISAASCVNASLYSSANMMYMMVTARELPPLESRRVWRGGTVGLLTTAGLVMVMSNLVDLTSIASLASLIFLLIYAAVHLGHAWRLTPQTGASRTIVIAALLANAAVFVLFLTSTIRHTPSLAWLLLIIIVIAAGTEIITSRIVGPITPARNIHDKAAADAGDPSTAS